ncbi:hypothetical protein LCGC14_0896960, partial [marine sediment metagenome]
MLAPKPLRQNNNMWEDILDSYNQEY